MWRQQTPLFKPSTLTRSPHKHTRRQLQHRGTETCPTPHKAVQFQAGPGEQSAATSDDGTAPSPVPHALDPSTRSLHSQTHRATQPGQTRRQVRLPEGCATHHRPWWGLPPRARCCRPPCGPGRCPHSWCCLLPSCVPCQRPLHLSQSVPWCEHPVLVASAEQHRRMIHKCYSEPHKASIKNTLPLKILKCCQSTWSFKAPSLWVIL